jgi:hypothetical protein
MRDSSCRESTLKQKEMSWGIYRMEERVSAGRCEREKRGRKFRWENWAGEKWREILARDKWRENWVEHVTGK